MSAPRLPPALIAISPGDLAGDGAVAQRRRSSFLRSLERARERGLRALLVRESELSDRALLELARETRRILGEEGWLAVHDRGHLVQATRADALHLGFRSLTPDVARAIVASGVALGFSGHAGDDVALWRSSDYVFFGPILETPSKRGLKTPVGFDGLERAVRESPVPVWALGGLKPEHAGRVRASGARGLAVLSGIFAAGDPAAAFEAYALALDGR
jgi:thiamine-phosphate diphosphorylase